MSALRLPLPLLLLAAAGLAACGNEVVVMRQRSARCDDGVQNGNERGVDCGGTCSPCQRRGCDGDDDCPGGACEGGTCVPAPLPNCGNGVVEAEEACDQGTGNAEVPDACRTDCTAPACGDGIRDTNEGCDDGGLASGDGCSAGCDVEPGWSCEGITPDLCMPIPTVCGDGMVDPGEECDEGPMSPNCDPDCTFAECGDGTVNPAAGELCDDAGESALCDVDCTFPVCGDGVLNSTAGESCDDGNTVDGDGCPSNCVNVVCDPTTEVSFQGKCYYLDGSGGTCLPGYVLAPQSVLASIGPMFAGKTYKTQISNNCCIWHADQPTELQDWGMEGDCNAAGPFSEGPVLGGANCTDIDNMLPQQLTLCVTQ